MYLFLGICGFLQSIFIPGFFLSTTAFRINSYSQLLPISFALSFICNYIIVTTLVIFHLYTQQIIIIIFLCEIFCITLLWKQGKLHLPPTFFSHASFCKKDNKIITNLSYLAGKIFLFILFGYILIYTSSQVGNIFNSWDAVVSWNRWAVDWASNRLPTTTWHYPQLVPIAYSLPYVFMGTSIIQSFSFLICLLWLPMGLVFLYDFYQLKKLYFSIIIASIGIYLWNMTIPSGYSDFPVCILSLFSCVTLLIWQKENNSHNSTYLLLSIIFAFSAAATKQGGIIWLLFLPFAIYESRCINFAPLHLKKIMVLCSILFIAVFSWYAFIRYQIACRGESSEISWVTQGIHEGRSYIERCYRVLQLWPRVGIVWALAWIGLSVQGLRVITLMGLFYTLIWAIFFSYDIRNFSPAIPFLIFAIGGVFTRNTIRFFNIIIHSYRYIPHIITCICFILLCICIVKDNYINNWLIERQNRKILNIGSRECNLLLIKKMEDHPLPFITDYQFAAFLPKIKNYYNLFHFSTPESIIAKEHLKEHLLDMIHIKSPCYIFLPTHLIERWFGDFPKENLCIEGEVSSYSLLLITKSNLL